MTDHHRTLGRRSFLASTLLAAGSAPAAADGTPVARGRRSAAPRTLEVVTTEAAELHYRFAVEGDVAPTRTSDRVGASANDAIIGGPDRSTVVVRGFTGNPGYGDAYEIDGELESFRRTGGSSDFYVRIDGERYDVDELADGDGSPASDGDVSCYHSAATVDVEDYDRVALSMTDGTSVEFADGYAGETTFGYAGDHAVSDGDATVDEFHGAVEAVTIVRGDRSRTFPAAEHVPGSDGVPLRYLRDAAFDGSMVDATVSGLGPCHLTVEFADGAVKSYAYDMSPVPVGSPGRVTDAAVFEHAPGTLSDFGVRVPNPDPADETAADPAVSFDCTAATIEEREYVNRYLGTPIELSVALTFADGSRQVHTIDDPSFPVTLGGTGDHDGKAIRRLRASDPAGRVISVPNPGVDDCR